MVKKRNKKGAIDDLVTIMGVLLFFAILVLVGFKFTSELKDKFAEGDIINAEGQAAVNQINDLYPTVVDNSFLFLMVGLLIVAIILAMLVAVHPVFFVLYFIFLIIVIFVGGVISNIYQEAAATAALAEIANQMTYMSHIMQFLPIIVGVFGFILAVVLYRSSRGLSG